MKKIFMLLFSLAVSIQAISQTDSLAVDMELLQKVIDSIENSFNYEYGLVELENDVAQVEVPEGFKFLNAKQSAYVMTELWENPPAEVLGMLFPEDISPISDNFTYAVEITYSKEGHIKDEDAEDIDYDDLLEEMQKDTKDQNPLRIKEGYESIELLGWASPPFYDKEQKKLHWAKELKFADYEEHTLNYNIRVLGRYGYLNLNAIGEMDALPLINNDIDVILGSVSFTEGNSYADFNPDIDKVAAYGIGGLIAGKVLAKAGLFAGLLKFWKIIAIAVVGVFGAMRKRIFGSKEE